MKARKICFCTLAILMGLTVGAAAQDVPVTDGKLPFRDSNSASISGRVMLPSGVMSSAHVKVILSTLRAPVATLYSDKNGEFHIDNLATGTYYLQIQADESVYEPLLQTVRLKPGEPAYLVLSLKEKSLLVSKKSSGNVVTIAENERAVPESARKSFEQARKRSEKGDAEGAITELNKAITIYPDYITARNALGVQYLKSRRWSEAAEQFTAILEKKPKYFDARLNLGIVFYEQKRFNEAIAELSQAVSLDSSNAAAHLFWGIAALEMNELVVAEKELVKALLFGGERYSNAHYYFAHVYLKTGRRGEAARELKIYLETSPTGELATHARALLEQLTAQK